MSTSSLLARSQLRKQRRLQENSAPSSDRGSSPAPASMSLPPAGGMNPGGSLGVDSSPNPFSNGSSSNMFPAPTRMGLPLIAQLKNFGDRTLKWIKLSDESESEFKRYLETNSKDERDALQFIHTLELKDMLVKSSEERSENWTPSSKLAKQIRKFIHALLLLPNIQYYSGTVESAVITAMRSSNIKDLPAADSFDCDQLTSFVARELSLARYAMKRTIQTSMDKTKGAEIHHITAMAAELLKHAPNVNATYGLYFRLALIRSHITQNHTAAEFWTKVDEQLQELHLESPEEFVGALETLYEEDLELYPIEGDQRRRGKPQWLQNLSAVAPKIQFVSKKQGTKRKRRQVEPEEEDESDQGARGQPPQPNVDEQQDGEGDEEETR
ncbi:hypothetical protein B0H14DRAFT_2566857 [Mycena olivaceomarginata]|nr:hypothetical protein B0H14DRAFT_2566857 [Mycena olivaceomarginata]